MGPSQPSFLAFSPGGMPQSQPEGGSHCGPWWSPAGRRVETEKLRLLAS